MKNKLICGLSILIPLTMLAGCATGKPIAPMDCEISKNDSYGESFSNYAYGNLSKPKFKGKLIRKIDISNTIKTERTIDHIDSDGNITNTDHVIEESEDITKNYFDFDGTFDGDFINNYLSINPNINMQDDSEFTAKIDNETSFHDPIGYLEVNRKPDSVSIRKNAESSFETIPADKDYYDYAFMFYDAVKNTFISPVDFTFYYGGFTNLDFLNGPYQYNSFFVYQIFQNTINLFKNKIDSNYYINFLISLLVNNDNINYSNALPLLSNLVNTFKSQGKDFLISTTSVGTAKIQQCTDQQYKQFSDLLFKMIKDFSKTLNGYEIHQDYFEKIKTQFPEHLYYKLEYNFIGDVCNSIKLDYDFKGGIIQHGSGFRSDGQTEEKYINYLIGGHATHEYYASFE